VASGAAKSGAGNSGGGRGGEERSEQSGEQRGERVPDRRDRHRDRRWFLATAAILACGAPWLPDRAALAPAVGLAALALAAGGAEAGIAAAWSAALALGTALLAAYPWLRRDPVAGALALLGEPPGWRLAAALAAAAGGLWAVVTLAGRREATKGQGRPAQRASPGAPAAGGAKTGAPAAGGAKTRAPAVSKATDSMAAAGAAADGATAAVAAADGATAAGAAKWGVAAGAAAGRAAAGVAVGIAIAVLGPLVWRPGRGLITPGGTVLLERAHPEWVTEMGPGRVAAVAVQSSLQNAAGLADGTPVARLRLQSTGDADIEVVIRAGRDSGEWSARRSDVAAGALLHSPAAWVSWVAGDFFGQSYRTRLTLPQAGSFARLRVELAPGLPAGIGLALYQVEIEP
jgi:hypothetical protein